MLPSFLYLYPETKVLDQALLRCYALDGRPEWALEEETI